MDKNIQTIQRYFKLSDLASTNFQARNEIISLFDDNAKIQSATNDSLQGHGQLVHFFNQFFDRNQRLKHICSVSYSNNQYSAEWAVAGIKHDNQLFALHGFDFYDFDENGKITSLTVEIR